MFDRSKKFSKFKTHSRIFIFFLSLYKSERPETVLLNGAQRSKLNLNAFILHLNYAIIFFSLLLAITVGFITRARKLFCFFQRHYLAHSFDNMTCLRREKLKSTVESSLAKKVSCEECFTEIFSHIDVKNSLNSLPRAHKLLALIHKHFFQFIKLYWCKQRASKFEFRNSENIIKHSRYSKLLQRNLLSFSRDLSQFGIFQLKSARETIFA